MSTRSIPPKTFKKSPPKTFTKSTPKTFTKKKAAPSGFSVPPESAPKPSRLHIFVRKFSIITVIQKIRTGKKTQTLTVLILGLLLVGTAGAAVYSFQLYQQSEKKVKTLQSSKDAAKVESQKTIDAVAKLIVLPNDETPTIATVTDNNKLKNQPFFAKASNGDKVLIYTKAKKAILFNPAQNKVVEVAPVNIGQNNKAEVAGAITQAPVPTNIPTPTVTIRTVTVPSVQPSTVPQQ